jgi:probable HAF family extracellular repeat protein
VSGGQDYTITAGRTDAGDVMPGGDGPTNLAHSRQPKAAQMAIFTRRVRFNNTNRGTNGRHRVGGLLTDAAGDLSGTTALAGANGDGTVFDIPSIEGSDPGTPASSNGTDGAYPDAGLIAAARNLSGTTIRTFTNMDTDMAAATATDNTTNVAATTVTTLATLVSFNGTNGANAGAGLSADAAAMANNYTFTTLDDPLGVSTVDSGINDSSQIVGSYGDSNGGGGFLYSNGIWTTLDDPSASGGTVPIGINASGQIVGDYIDYIGSSGTQQHGFLYSNGTWTTLGDPSASGEGTVARDINDSGQIVRTYYGSGNVAHGFLYSNGTWTTLDDPLATTGNVSFVGTDASGINDSGQIVGWYFDSSLLISHGFLYSNGRLRASAAFTAPTPAT